MKLQLLIVALLLCAGVVPEHVTAAEINVPGDYLTIQAAVDAVSGICETTCSAEICANTDITPCEGDGDVDLLDMLEFMDALRGQPGVICPGS